MADNTDDVANNQSFLDIEEATFINWANTRLGGEEHLYELTDLADGVLIVRLVEALTARTVTDTVDDPQTEEEVRQNVTAALNFLLSKERVKMIQITADDILRGDRNLLLGFVWCLVLHFDIHHHHLHTAGEQAGCDQTAQDVLLTWVNSLIPLLELSNFTEDWRDGLAVWALVRRFSPASLPRAPPQNDLETATLALEAAERDLGVPRIIAPVDWVAPECDHLSTMTYVALFRKQVASHEELRRASIPQLDSISAAPPLEQPSALDSQFHSELAQNGRRRSTMASIVGEEGGMHYHQGADGNLEGEYVTEKFVRHRPKIPACHLCREAVQPADLVVDANDKAYHQDCFFYGVVQQKNTRTEQKIARETVEESASTFREKKHRRSSGKNKSGRRVVKKTYYVEGGDATRSRRRGGRDEYYTRHTFESDLSDEDARVIGYAGNGLRGRGKRYVTTYIDEDGALVEETREVVRGSKSSKSRGHSSSSKSRRHRSSSGTRPDHHGDERRVYYHHSHHSHHGGHGSRSGGGGMMVGAGGQYSSRHKRSSGSYGRRSSGYASARSSGGGGYMGSSMLRSRTIEYEVAIAGWEGKVWQAPTNGPVNARHFPVNVHPSYTSDRMGLRGPMWLRIDPSFCTLVDRETWAEIYAWPMNHVRRFGKDVKVLSMEIGVINPEAHGTLYFETSRCDQAFDLLTDLCSAW